MPKYIDAEKIEYKTMLFPVLDGMLVRTKKIENIVERQEIDKIQTADVQEVKHGKWIDRGWHPISIEGSAHFYKCSICAHKQIGTSEYCPNCGARMDGDEK